MRPTNCMPTGRPPSVQWSGSEIAGWPVELNSGVKAHHSKTWRVQVAGSIPAAFWSSVPSLIGGLARVGVSSRS